MNTVTWMKVGLVIALVFLSGCVPIPDRIDFLTDGRVLRGVYEGTGTTESVYIPADARTLALRLEVVPEYVDQKTYALTGTVTIGDEEPVPFEGEASGGDTQVYVRMQPIRTPSFYIRFSYKGELWRLEGLYPEEGGGSRRTGWGVALGPMDAGNFGPYQANLAPVQ